MANESISSSTQKPARISLLVLISIFGVISIVGTGGGGNGDGDTTPPTVTSNSPDNNATGVLTAVQLSVTFSEAVDAATINNSSFILVDGSSNPVSGTVSYASGTKTATFTPNNDLDNSTAYTATISTAVTDVAGNPMAASHSWSFTTGAPDATPPSVSSTNPLNRAYGALLSGPVTATFDEPLDPATVNTNSFVVMDSSGAVSGTVSLSSDGLTASFTPTTPFSYAQRYDVEMTTEVADLAGNQLAGNYNWFFNSGKRLAMGRAHVCARLDDGGVKCWGGGFDGQLGLGDPNDRGDEPGEMGSNLPRVDLGTGRKAVQIVAGNWHNCARLDDGTVKCWGAEAMLGLGGGMSDLGDAPDEMGDNLPTVDLGTGRTAIRLAAGGHHTCAILDNEQLKCWGNNGIGQLGLGDTEGRGDQPGEMGDNLPLVDLGTGRTARGIAAGMEHTCARLDDGSVKCWGTSLYGQVGLGDTSIRGDEANEMGDNLPAVNLGTGRTANGLIAGGYHTCARLDDNSIKCWGYNNAGQLGLGDRDTRGDNETIDTVPTVDLGTGHTARSLAAGFSHSCARLDDNSVKCWGYAPYGELGYEDEVTRGDEPGEMGDNLPIVDLGTGLTAIEIMARFNTTCANLDDNNVKCWGSNYVGQLGQGDIVDRGDDADEMGDNLPAIDIGN